MESTIGSILAFIIVVFSYKGLSDATFREHYIFDIDKILIKKEYYRIISAAFLHGSWFHLGFNVIALLAFSGTVEVVYGWWQYLILFFGSVLFAKALTLFFHRNHGDYRALGASGGVSGILMAFVMADPFGKIGFIMLPISFTAWMFAVAYVVITIIAIKRSNDNIGHEAHLGGAIGGVLLAIVFMPSLLLVRTWLIALILVPAILFLWMSIKNPAFFLIKDYWGFSNKKNRSPLRIRHKKEKISREEELNLLLAKIKQKGLENLTKRERRRLEDLSNE